MPSRTVHLIDDDPAMRDSLGFLLEMQGFAPRLFDSAQAFLEALPDLPMAGCILTDLRMPGMSGLELVARLKVEGVSLPVVVMTGHGDVGLAVEAMKAGVVDFIEKPFSAEVLVKAIQGALSRDPAPAEGQERRAAEQRLEGLSPRERDVLKGVVQGHANKVIAHQLGISPRTVEIYRANLMSKVGVRTLSDLMRIALAAGL